MLLYLIIQKRLMIKDEESFQSKLVSGSIQIVAWLSHFICFCVRIKEIKLEGSEHDLHRFDRMGGPL